MSRSDKNKALVRRAWKLADNPDVLDEVYAPDVVWQEPDQEIRGLEQAKRFVTTYKTAFVTSGSGAPDRSLLRHGQLDELKLMIHPVLVGSAKRLFEEGEGQTKLELVDSRTFSTGVLYLTYRPPARG